MDCFAVRMIPGSGRYYTRVHCIIPPEENSENDLNVAPANRALLLPREDVA